MSSSYADTPPQTPPGKGSRGSPGSPLVLDENELVSELAFARWKVEMANRLVVAQEKKCLRSPVPLASASLLAECAVPSPVRRAGSMCLCRVGRRVRGSCAVGVVLISA